MKKSHIAIILPTLAVCSFGLWLLLSLYSGFVSRGIQELPGFTRLLVECRALVLALPVPLALYSVLALCRSAYSQERATTISLWSVSAFVVALFPILWAVILPCVKLMEQNWRA
jgi:hypothetical protein